MSVPGTFEHLHDRCRRHLHPHIEKGTHRVADLEMAVTGVTLTPMVTALHDDHGPPAKAARDV